MQKLLQNLKTRVEENLDLQVKLLPFRLCIQTVIDAFLFAWDGKEIVIAPFDDYSMTCDLRVMVAPDALEAIKQGGSWIGQIFKGEVSFDRRPMAFNYFVMITEK